MDKTEFSVDDVSLWGWATKKGQEVVLAIKLKRTAFDYILSQAVHSLFSQKIYGSHEVWKIAIDNSNVRLQWDPDHNPQVEALERRAIRLGLRGEVILKYSREWILDIEDITSFVAKQRGYALSGDYENLLNPKENVYILKEDNISAKLGI